MPVLRGVKDRSSSKHHASSANTMAKDVAEQIAKCETTHHYAQSFITLINNFCMGLPLRRSAKGAHTGAGIACLHEPTGVDVSVTPILI
jgi:hypothetical protein